MSDLVDQELVTRRKARRMIILVIAAALVVIALIAAIVLWVTGSDSGSGSKNKGNRSENTTAPDHLEDGVVDLPDLGTLVQQGDLSGLTWRPLYGLEVPSSSQHGPKTTSDGRAEGFSHDPVGALVAASNVVVCANSSAGSDVFAPAIEEQFVGGDKDKLLSSTRDDYDDERQRQGVAKGKPLAGEANPLSGFKFSAYDDNITIVHLLFPVPPSGQGEASYQDLKIEMRWEKGDWRLVAPPGGDWVHNVSLVKTPEGYTMTGRG